MPINVLLAITLLAAIILLTRHHSQAEQGWTQERRELLNRIQRPDHIPVAVTDQWVMPDVEGDELALVGTVAEPKDE